MKILHLYLKNFAHIFSGLGKYEIDLDFTDSNKVINVIVGKMGSCKTVILGSLQPFQSFGTLDIRNQDSLIIEKEDGQKIIEYADGPNIYKITHNYTWNKTTHNIKSYIEKNGVELNPNGNQSSFKDIIEIEFGIEQNFLRLLRLGANVSNVINMKSTERKTFIASLLKDAEIYSLLYKKLNDEMKNLNSQTSILSNKLNHIGVDKEEEIKNEYDNNQEKIIELKKRYENTNTKIYELQGLIKSILQSSSYEEYKNTYDNYLEEYNDLLKKLSTLNNMIQKYDDSESINDVSKAIGKLDATISQLNTLIINTEKYYQDCSIELSKYVDTKKMANNEEKLNDLRFHYNELLEKLKQYKSEVDGFNSPFNATQVTRLMGELREIDLIISEITQYDREVVKRIYSSDKSIINWSKKQIDILTYKKIKLQKDINNIRYSEKYEVPSKLFIPPFCPTETCPYYATHPFTIQQKSQKKTDTDTPSDLEIIMNQIETLDLQINKYEVYPILYVKISTVKSMWSQVYKSLEKLYSLKEKSLLYILTNSERQNWYDSDKLVKIVELCTKRDSYYELLENVNKVKSEIQAIEVIKDSTIDEKISYLEKEIDESTEKLSDYESQLKLCTKKLTDYNNLYIELSRLDGYLKDRDTISQSISSMKDNLSTMERNLESVNDNYGILQELKKNSLEDYAKLKSVTERNEQIKTVLNDLDFTKHEFDKVLEDKENLKYILDAVSSKEGIPLILVKMFLNNCRDIINELVSDVFGDIIEILEFNITQDEFKIPYTINGVKVDDIERASQGQQAVISIALSFALIRQSMFKYNIMLLDEIDGPLYKHDRSKFVTILMKQLQAISGEQVFLISHNAEIFNQMNINYVCTTDELIDENTTNSIMHV